MKKTRRPPLVLAIGGFDPSCGAGVVADARSIDAMGALPLAVVTALTIQSGSGVRAFRAVGAATVAAQLDELFANLPVAVVKIGQIPGLAVARVVARRIRDAALPMVLDPVLVASGGGSLVSRGAADAIRTLLLPLASMVTVNLAEASALTGRRVTGVDGMRRAAADLEALGAASVLVKGGHLRGDPMDLLRHGGHETLLRGRRIAGSMHGTGCALASAIATRLASGDDFEAAVRAARDHVRDLLKTASQVHASRLRAPASY